MIIGEDRVLAGFMARVMLALLIIVIFALPLLQYASS